MTLSTCIIKSFADIRNFNLRFIQGLEPFAPYYCGPINPETQTSLPQLILINQLGYSTEGSQPGRHNERAYLSGIGTHKTAQKLYELNYGDLIVRDRRCDSAFPDPNARIAVTWGTHDKTCAAHKGSSCSCSRPKGPADPNAKWFYTWAAPFDHFYSWDNLISKAVSTKLKKQLYAICIIDPVWGRDATTPKTGLLDRVIEALES